MRRVVFNFSRFVRPADSLKKQRNCATRSPGEKKTLTMKLRGKLGNLRLKGSGTHQYIIHGLNTFADCAPTHATSSSSTFATSGYLLPTWLLPTSTTALWALLGEFRSDLHRFTGLIGYFNQFHFLCHGPSCSMDRHQQWEVNLRCIYFCQHSV